VLVRLVATGTAPAAVGVGDPLFPSQVLNTSLDFTQLPNSFPLHSLGHLTLQAESALCLAVS
jgi:hypothetical protein